MAPNKHLIDFINSIPARKLTGLPTSGKTLHSDRTFRVDMQGMTSDKLPKFKSTTSQLSRATSRPRGRPWLVLSSRVVVRTGWIAEKIRAELIEKIVPVEKLKPAKKALPKLMSKSNKGTKPKRN